MAAYYTVVRAVPDPIAAEFVNFGVVVFGDGEVRTRFLRNWGRVEAFANEDVSYLHEFTGQFQRDAAQTLVNVQQQPLDAFAQLPVIEEEGLRRIADEWSNAIQFAPIEVAEGDPELLLEELADLFLKEGPTRGRAYRDAATAARLAETWVRDAFARRLGPTRTKSVVWGKRELPGKTYDRNRVDVVVVNGRFHLAARGLSFEIQGRDRLEAQVGQTILQLGDLRARYGDIQLGIVALLPKDETKFSGFARDLYRETQVYSSRIQADLVDEQEGPQWVERIADEVIPEIERESRAEISMVP